MTKAEYIEFHKAACERMMTITKAKNADYTGTSQDPFANFASSEVVAGVTTEQGFLVRMGDKMARLKSFAQKGTLEVKDESFEDTCFDLANYCLLLAGFVRARKQ
jgi:hypothetical protein